MLEDVKIEEYTDYEPANVAVKSRNSASPDAPPDGRSGRGHDHADAAANHGTEPLGRTSRAIADTLNDLAAGHANGQYPTVESIIKREPVASIIQRGRSTASATTAPDRQNAHKSPVATPRRGYITDIRPPMRERVAILEHEMADTENDLAQVRENMGKFATHREMIHADTELDKRIDNAHLRIDRDVLPELKALRSSNNLKLVVAVVGLLISMAANIIAVYRYFMRP